MAVARCCSVSRLSWQAVLEGAERAGASPERIAAIEFAAEVALDAWYDALELVEAGDLAGAKRELLEARWQAANWGDAQPERQALAALMQSAS
jgi:hypothetical protein